MVGIEHWTCHFDPWGDTGIIARLTILGITRESSGEGDPSDPNCKTSAEGQAFKRAFSKFGFRLLYRLPKLWADYDEQAKGFVNPAAVVIQLYHAVSWDEYIVEETAREVHARASDGQAMAAAPPRHPPPPALPTALSVPASNAPAKPWPVRRHAPGSPVEWVATLA